MRDMETEGSRKNHEKTCGGGRAEREGRRECGECGAWITVANYARHRRGCGDGGGGLLVS